MTKNFEDQTGGIAVLLILVLVCINNHTDTNGWPAFENNILIATKVI
jgi:hypothetical protein